MSRPRCRTCGATARVAAVICSTCGAGIDETRAYDARTFAPETTCVTTPPPADDVEIDHATDVTIADAAVPGDPAIDRAWLAMLAVAEQASRSAAELVWDSLDGEDQTAVWSPDDCTDAGMRLADAADTSEEALEENPALRDTARHAAIPLRWVDTWHASPELPVFTTSRMPPARAALLLRLAPTGYAGYGTPVDAAVVPRGQILDVGRACAGPWAGDPYLDERHVRLLTDADGVRVIDDGSRGGVWLRIAGARWLRSGDCFRIGEQFLRYDGLANGARGHLQLIDHEECFGPTIAIEAVTVLGRVAPDVVLMHDPYVSGEHCRIVPTEGGVLLEDLDSSNGTWVRLRSGDLIPFGGVVAIGRSVYRVEAAESDG